MNPNAGKPTRMLLSQVPARRLFRTRSGTLYLKMPDGSIRNVAKAAKKMRIIKDTKEEKKS